MKLFHKIAVTTLGIVMATAVGAGVAHYNRGDIRAAKAATGTAELDFSTVTQCTEATTSSLVYSDGSIKLAAAKGSASTNTNNYYPGTSGKTYTSTRFYKNSTIEITSANSTVRYITNIEITATSNSYANALGNSTWTGGVAAVSGSKVTVTPSTNITSVSATLSDTAGVTAVSIDWTTTPVTTASLAINKNTLGLATTTSDAISVSFANLSSDVSISQSSTNGGQVTLSQASISKSATSPVEVTVSGKTAGDVVLTFSAAGVSDVTCNVNVSLPNLYSKITKASLVKDGGTFIIAAKDTNKVLSSTINNNDRPETSATIIDNKLNIPNVTNVATLKFKRGTGDFADSYYIQDLSYSNPSYSYGFLEQYNGNLKTYGLNDIPTQNYYYWNISFNADGNALIQNVQDTTLFLEYNSSSKIFKTYKSTQVKIDLYELDSDIPSETPLTSIAAENISVGEGSTITYTASYSPANATQNITVSLTNNIAELGALSMNNGTITFTIRGGEVEADSNTTMTLSGPNGTVSASVTLTVTNYEATHTLVTAASSLTNGAKVVIASQETGCDVSAVEHTGGNYLNTTPTAFDSTKTTLSKAVNSCEFTIWCVDSEHGYYVISDGGYFLAAPATKNNYLIRTDVLNEQCYFTINDSDEGIELVSYFSVLNEWTYKIENVDTITPFVIRYNSGNPRFSLYSSAATSMKKAALYISNATVNKVQGFIDAFMHFGNVSKETVSDTGACKDDGKGYFASALLAYNMLSASEKESFCTVGTYEDAFNRLSSWAAVNDYHFEGYNLVKNARQTLSINSKSDVATITIVTASIAAISLAGFFLVLRKRKEQ